MKVNMKLFVKIFVIVLCVGLVGMIGIVAGSFFGMVDITEKLSVGELQLDSTSLIYYIDEKTDEPVEYDRLHGEKNRVWVNYEDINEYFRNALISVEDKRFYKHRGFDIKSTSKAVFDYILKRDGRGASTITQQLVKNLTGDKDITATRKIKEIIRAVALETQLSKEEILELYMNTIYLSRGCYGVGSAAKYYFDKAPEDLTLAESAAIAGITQYPSLYDPISNPEKNKEKQEIILELMLENEYIDQTEYDEAMNEKLDFGQNKDNNSASNSYFTDMVIDDVLNDLCNIKGYSRQIAEKMLYNGGLKIYSTVDYELQEAMEDVFENPASFQKAPRDTQPEAAMVSIDPQTGHIKAVVGGRGEKTGSRTLNRATQSLRQPGSTIKPIAVYAPAIEKNIITPASVYYDEPIRYGSWAPKNHYSGFKGQVSIDYAVEQSINTVAVKVYEQLGATNGYNFLRNNFHISSLTENDKQLAVSLGGLSQGISPLEMTAAYCTFANRGIYNQPISYTKVLDANDNVILEKTSKSTKAISEQTAAVMLSMLKNVVSYGTGTASRFSSAYEIGGKTGTTDGDKDRWYIGLTPYYVSAVWVGYDTPAPMPFFGANPCVTAWTKVMKQAHTGKPAKKFPESNGVTLRSFCHLSGANPTESCSVRSALFKSGTYPTSVECKHLQAEEESEETEITEEGITNEPTHSSKPTENTNDVLTNIPTSENGL